jgi:hypothetical protein
MFAFLSGDQAFSRPRAALVCAAASAAISLSGCASTRTQQAMNSGAASGPAVMSWTLFDSEPQPVPRPVAVKEDLEDDGMAAQTAPPKSHRLQPDDPTQPWSPNYGRTPAFPSQHAQDGAVLPPQAMLPGQPLKPAQMASQDTE